MRNTGKNNIENDFFYSCCHNAVGSAGCEYGKHTNNLKSFME